MALPVAASGTGYATLWALCSQRGHEPTLCIYRASNLGRRFTGLTSTLTKVYPTYWSKKAASALRSSRLAKVVPPATPSWHKEQISGFSIVKISQLRNPRAKGLCAPGLWLRSASALRNNVLRNHPLPGMSVALSRFAFQTFLPLIRPRWHVAHQF